MEGKIVEKWLTSGMETDLLLSFCIPHLIILHLKNLKTDKFDDWLKFAAWEAEFTYWHLKFVETDAP